MRARSIYHAISAVLLLSVGALHAQGPAGTMNDFRTASHWVVGYTVNAPSQLMGFSTMFFGPRLGDWGLYADYKTTMDSPADLAEYDPSMSVDRAENEFGDRYVGFESAWTTVNLAVAHAITGSLALYAGGGYSRENAYRQYFDGDQERGLYGYYWADDGVASGTRINLLAGAWFRATPRLLFQFGGETAPRGFTVGAAFVLPFLR